MREITEIFVHTSATVQNAKLSAILRFWKSNNGWDYPGYHKIILPDGWCVRLLPDSIPSNGVKGHNANALHICWIGGKDGIDNRTLEQKETLEVELRKWRYLYKEAEIKGHRDAPGVVKTCPNFDVKKEYRSI